jgi:hypothetical protein
MVIAIFFCFIFPILLLGCLILIYEYKKYYNYQKIFHINIDDENNISCYINFALKQENIYINKKYYKRYYIKDEKTKKIEMNYNHISYLIIQSIRVERFSWDRKYNFIICANGKKIKEI